MKHLRSILYALARGMGTGFAILGGPGKLFKRILRIILGRTFGAILRRWLP